MTDQSKDKFINVEKVFKSKNKKFGSLMPRFVFKFIENLVHQDDINEFLAENGQYTGLEFTQKVVEHFKVSYEFIGGENLPEDPKVIIASNHPFGGVEGIVMTKYIGDHYGDVRVPSNDILMSVKNFQPLFIPVNKHGSNSKEAAIMLDKSLASEIPLLIYPSGLVSRKVNGKLRDLPWKKTFITKAIKYNRPIIPTFVEGKNSRLFYFVAGLRKLLRIKVNIEMFLLPYELFRMYNSKLTIHFAPPVPPEFFDKRYKPIEWAHHFQNYIYHFASGDTRTFMKYIEDLK